ncbi:MAG: ribonuclease P protein component [Microbacteriaceae bacterium]|nr:ribonuclease P protein component [Microbacteriaceae bacterium]
MLARTNRLLTAADFRGVLRRGKRHSARVMTVSTLSTQEGSPARFGFIVTKKVGNAVRRNLVRRRLKAIARDLVDGGLCEIDVVVRALPASADSGWVTLRDELVTTVKGSALR